MPKATQIGASAAPDIPQGGEGDFVKKVLFWVAVGMVLWFMFSISRPTQTIKGEGVFDLQRQPDGHYYLRGYLNGQPAEFMVDTGASVTTVSQPLADKAGIRACVPRNFVTAAGPVVGCVGKASVIQLGEVVLHGYEVAIIPGMVNDGLLGMDILGRLKLEQQDDIMRLSVHR